MEYKWHAANRNIQRHSGGATGIGPGISPVELAGASMDFPNLSFVSSSPRCRSRGVLFRHQRAGANHIECGGFEDNESYSHSISELPISQQQIGSNSLSELTVESGSWLNPIKQEASNILGREESCRVDYASSFGSKRPWSGAG